MKTQRIHNEYFQPIARKSCPCGSNSVRGGKKYQVFSWGEYVHARWNTIEHFCEKCFHIRIIPKLTSHMENCGCTFKLRPRNGYDIPPWITMNECFIQR